MLKNIILKEWPTKSKGISNQRTHFSKKCSIRATIEGIAADEIRNGLNELFYQWRD